MGQGALSEPVVEWCLSLNPSSNKHGERGWGQWAGLVREIMHGQHPGREFRRFWLICAKPGFFFPRVSAKLSLLLFLFFVVVDFFGVFLLCFLGGVCVVLGVLFLFFAR